MIHHHVAMPRHGQDEDAYDVIESGDGQVDIWHHGLAIRQDVGTPDEAIEQADRLADAYDARAVEAMGPLPPRQGDPVKASDVHAFDILDLYGDRYADPYRDPGKGFEFESVEVESIEFETPDCVVIYTDGVNFGCPPDHIVYRRRRTWQEAVSASGMHAEGYRHTAGNRFAKLPEKKGGKMKWATVRHDDTGHHWIEFDD